MLQLKGIHKGETAYIIGKGKSLLNLKRSDIGVGIIIAIYEAIIPIEMLGFLNVTYSLQKDGGLHKNVPHSPSPDCDRRDCDYCEWVVRPRKSTLLLHEQEAKYCFEDYKPRYLFTLEEIGMDHNEFSLVCAIKIAQFMGCEKFKFVSCDAHTHGDTENCVPVMEQSYYDWIYHKQREILPEYLKGLNVEWITPK